MPKSIITGGAGFIGFHLSKALLARQHHVIAIDNLITGSQENIDELSKNPAFTFINHDVIQPVTSHEEQLKDTEYIFHLASPASPNAKSERSYIAHPIETALANSVGTYNLLELAKKRKAHFLFASTSEAYGDPAISPQKEDYRGNVSSTGIRSVYDEGKRFGEAITFAYGRKFGVNVRIIRIFNTFGPNMQPDDGRFISNFINQAIRNEPITIYGEGKQTRSSCYVDDLVEGILSAMFSEQTNMEVFNLGNPDERTIIEHAELIKKLTGSTSSYVYEPMPEDDPMQRQPDISKAKRMLGFTPKVSLEEGLTKTIQYFKSIQK